MPEQCPPTGAVFLSYASEDADAAARICETLRAAGVEVWFDKSELRGGDAWDSQIKKQIHECALFIPLISAHTNARSEGYFRGEWHLAIRRLHNMAEDAAFLVPVVIDDTREAGARVPEVFFQAHWTWLPGGETPPAFLKRVRELLGLDPGPTGKAATPTANVPSAVSGVRTRLHDTSILRRFGAPLIALLLILSGGAFWYYQATNSTPAAIPVPATSRDTQAAAVPAEASVAVLPFVNMSSDPEQEYFSDGLSEQVLNLLSKVPGLRVIARTSSFAFKGKDMDVATIGQRLNVAYVLEGSVRKSGNRVRINAQLIDTANSSHQWSETYDRELSDIFSLQDEIALAVVHELQVALQSDELPSRSTKTGIEAFNLFLRGEFLRAQHTEESLNRAVEYYEKALGIDPQYAEAWAALAYVHTILANEGFTDFSIGFEKARASARKAHNLNPNLARAHLALGSVQQFHDWDWIAADASFDKAIALAPGDADVLANASFSANLLGDLDLGMDLCKQAVAHDPVAPFPRSTLAASYMYAGQLDQAEKEMRATLEISPDFSFGRYLLGVILLLKGQATPALKVALEQSNELWGLALLPLAYYAAGQVDASDAALKKLIEVGADKSAYQIAEAYAFRGQHDLAFTWLDRAYSQR